MSPSQSRRNVFRSKFGRVQVSEELHNLIGKLGPARDEPREIHIKGKGMKTARHVIARAKIGRGAQLQKSSIHRNRKQQRRLSLRLKEQHPAGLVPVPGPALGAWSDLKNMAAKSRVDAWPAGSKNLSLFRSSSLPALLSKAESKPNSPMNPTQTNGMQVPALGLLHSVMSGTRGHISPSDDARGSTPLVKDLFTWKERVGNFPVHRRNTMPELDFEATPESLDDVALDKHMQTALQSMFEAHGDFEDYEFWPFGDEFSSRVHEYQYRVEMSGRKAQAASYFFVISQTMYIATFAPILLLGSNEGWGWSTKKSSWILSEVRVPLWMGPTFAAILLLMLIISLKGRRTETFWDTEALLVGHSILFGLAIILAMVGCNSPLLVMGSAVFLSQVAFSRMKLFNASIITTFFSSASVACCFLQEIFGTKFGIVAYTVSIFVCNAVVLRSIMDSQRQSRYLWATKRQVSHDHENLQKVLFDLLPRPYAIKLIKDPTAAIPGGLTHAVILFSDLSGFTGLTERLGPETIVKMMHELWCCFDALVQKHSMYKMDTVGDAYVVLGLANDEEDLKWQAARMILLAKEIIINLEDLSNQMDEKLAIRIGIDCGQVMAGVLGKLQPRFHAHGGIVTNAQRLEGLCTKGMVLLSDNVVKMLSEEGEKIVPGDLTPPVGKNPGRYTNNYVSKAREVLVAGAATIRRADWGQVKSIFPSLRRSSASNLVHPDSPFLNPSSPSLNASSRNQTRNSSPVRPRTRSGSPSRSPGRSISPNRNNLIDSPFATRSDNGELMQAWSTENSFTHSARQILLKMRMKSADSGVAEDLEAEADMRMDEVVVLQEQSPDRHAVLQGQSPDRHAACKRLNILADMGLNKMFEELQGNVYDGSSQSQSNKKRKAARRISINTNVLNSSPKSPYTLRSRGDKCHTIDGIHRKISEENLSISPMSHLPGFAALPESVRANMSEAMHNFMTRRSDGDGESSQANSERMFPPLFGNEARDRKAKHTLETSLHKRLLSDDVKMTRKMSSECADGETGRSPLQTKFSSDVEIREIQESSGDPNIITFSSTKTNQSVQRASASEGHEIVGASDERDTKDTVEVPQVQDDRDILRSESGGSTATLGEAVEDRYSA